MSWVSRLQVLQLLQTVPIKYGKVYRVYFSRDNVYLALVLTRLLSYTHLEDNPLDCIRQLTAVLQLDYRPQKETFLIDSNRALMTILEKNSHKAKPDERKHRDKRHHAAARAGCLGSQMIGGRYT